MSLYKQFYLSEDYGLSKLSIERRDFLFIPEVFDAFENEWKKSGILYRDFINKKELGLLANVTKENEYDWGIGVHSDYYKVVDEKQWFLAKIKYGF